MRMGEYTKDTSILDIILNLNQGGHVCEIRLDFQQCTSYLFGFDTDALDDFVQRQ